MIRVDLTYQENDAMWNNFPFENENITDYWHNRIIVRLVL